MITTYSSFYYGHAITEDNRYICIVEGTDPEIIAAISIGNYSLTKFVQKVEQALNDAGLLTYTVTLNRTTGIITIGASGAFKILGVTGTRSGQQALSKMGFLSLDTALSTSHIGSFRSGSVYEPQFLLQDYVDPRHNKSLANATVSKSADGSKVSIQSFGEVRLMKCNIRFATNQVTDPTVIKYNPQGVEDLTAFLEYCVTGSPIEFMPDLNTPETYYRVRLDSTEVSQDGIEFELKERYDLGLPYYFDSGKLIFRLVTE